MCFYNDEVKKDAMDSACSTNGTKRNTYRIFMGKPERKRLLGRPRRRWVDNIKVDFRQDDMVWIGFVWLRIGSSGGLL
jgi:hypothetical protein